MIGPMTRRGATAALWMLGVSMLGCALIPKSQRLEEERSMQIPGTDIKTIAVIAGGDTRGELRMSVRVRQQLEEGGWAAMPRAGRWENETGAVEDICSHG